MSRSGRAITPVAKGGRRPDHWLCAACELIDNRIADASLHVSTGDAGTGTARVGELATGLNQIIRDARADFYHRSFAAHAKRGLDPRIHRTDIGPTKEGEAAARDARILGRHLPTDLGEMASKAKSLLRLAEYGEDGLATWVKVHRASFRAFAERSLTDSRTAINHAVGRVLIKPELRD
jgi:hypothetical protein